MVMMSHETFLHRLYISYYISFRDVLIENHQFLYNEDPILVPFGPLLYPLSMFGMEFASRETPYFSA